MVSEKPLLSYVLYTSTVCALYTHNAIIYVRVASVIATIGYF